MYLYLEVLFVYLWGLGIIHSVARSGILFGLTKEKLTKGWGLPAFCFCVFITFMASGFGNSSKHHRWSQRLRWIDGEAVEIKGTDAVIVTSNGKTIVSAISSIYPTGMEATPAGVDDMTKLAYFHEPGVLYYLASRFVLNEIYIYTGNILIAVDPFRSLPHLYDVHMMEQYKGAAFGVLSPHLFAVADTCYRFISCTE